MKTINEISLRETIPANLSKDKNVSAAIDAFDKKFLAIAKQTDVPSIYINLNKLTSLELDHLAHQYDVDAWRDGWNIAVKRSVLKTAIADKRKKGTLSAVKQAIASLGGTASITEWWQKEPKGTPHTFTINVVLPNIDGILETEMQEDLIAMIDGAKPLRSHYSFVLNTAMSGKFSAIGFIRTLSVGSVRSRDIITDDITASVGMLAVARSSTSRYLIAKGV